MNKSSNTERGFTLTEVLVTAAIIGISLPFAVSMLINSQLLASYSKHRIQAAYAAQQIIETQRQQPISYFAPMLKTTTPTIITAWVMLDTGGNYNNTTCTSGNLPCGTATITITPKIYTYSVGPPLIQNTATYQPPAPGVAYSYYTIAHIDVAISWSEQISTTKVSKKVLMNENYDADIMVNDALLN